MKTDVKDSEKNNALVSLITIPEVAQDVSKWVAYNLLLPEYATEPFNPPFVSAYGALAGIIGNFFYEFLKKSKVDQVSFMN